MKLRFVWVGKTKDRNYKALEDEYLGRLRRFATVEIVEVRDAQPPDRKQTESQRILEKLNPTTYVCLLDVEGKHLSSRQLAAELEAWQNRGLKEVVFVIGGSDGVTDAVGQRADLRLSLSFMTFTHEMARVILLEQLYRSYTILRGFPYQK
ncbi:MAG: 23S rRNA (pseudouridine(1915)-N(3))-methyltransferase RlmH [Pyrinomonadaceae bacterium]